MTNLPTQVQPHRILHQPPRVQQQQQQQQQHNGHNHGPSNNPRVQQSEKQFKCDFCDKTFTQRRNQRAHIRTVHEKMATTRMTTRSMKVKVEVKNEMLANSQGQQVMDDDPQLAVSVQGQEPLAASMSAQEPPSEQKQMLGQRLFPLIQGLYPDLAGKITDMLLEMDNSELVNMLEHEESLKKIEEAVASLKVATPTTASGSVIKTGKNFAP